MELDLNQQQQWLGRVPKSDKGKFLNGKPEKLGRLAKSDGKGGMTT
jgi:hypothetical protein